MRAGWVKTILAYTLHRPFLAFLFILNLQTRRVVGVTDERKSQGVLCFIGFVTIGAMDDRKIRSVDFV
jgi:hypothetical protein